MNGITRGPIEFEGLGMCFYKTGEFRPPLKGEFYLSGSIVQAFRAPNHLGFSYRVAVPTYKAKQVMTWVKGDPIEVTSK